MIYLSPWQRKRIIMRNEDIILTPQQNSFWDITYDGFFKTHIAHKLQEDGIPVESVEDIFQNAVGILRYCPCPLDRTPLARTGLVVGKVQSGKTSNFIGLMALGFDNGYPISIVLGGNKNLLLEQNERRIKSYYEGIDVDKLVILTTNANKSLLNPRAIKGFIDEGRRVIIVGLKHHKHMRRIADIFNKSSITDVPTLIIDDEGDQATLRANQKRIPATYASALSIKKNISVHGFVSITATPQANILIDTIDALSPDFGVLVYPGRGYCGLAAFHGVNEDIHIKDNIDDTEESLLESQGIPPSFYQALAAFFVGKAIREYRGDNSHHTMLIHPSQLKIDHTQVIVKIQRLLDDWKMKANTKLGGNNDIAYKSLRQHLLFAYNSFISDGVSTAPFAELENLILSSIICCPPDIFKCNSDDDQSENAKLYKISIFVGGNMLERGITLKGLAVTYILRRARGVANVDTTEQRARWFGYKSGYMDVCRVYTTRAIKDDFSAIYDHEEDLWATIENANIQGATFKEISRIFRLANNSLRLTRPGIAHTERLQYSEWVRQNTLIVHKNVTDHNEDVIRSYREYHFAELEKISFSKVQTHVILHNMEYGEVCEKLLSRIVYPPGTVDDKVFGAIRDILQKSSLDARVDVLWMRDGNLEERTIKDDGTINNIFQGSNKELGDPLYYPGDRYLEKNSRMQLQIHFIKPKNIPTINYQVPVVALYLPPNYNEVISSYVKRR